MYFTCFIDTNGFNVLKKSVKLSSIDSDSIFQMCIRILCIWCFLVKYILNEYLLFT